MGDKLYRGPQGSTPANEASSRIGYFSFDAVSELVHLSDRAAAIYGFASDDARGGIPLAALGERIHVDDRAELLAKVRAQSGGAFKRQYRFHRPDDGVVTLRVRGYCFTNPDGGPERHVGTVAIVDVASEGDRLGILVDQTLASYELAAGRPVLQYLFGMALTELGFDLARR